MTVDCAVHGMYALQTFFIFIVFQKIKGRLHCGVLKNRIQILELYMDDVMVTNEVIMNTATSHYNGFLQEEEKKEDIESILIWLQVVVYLIVIRLG